MSLGETTKCDLSAGIAKVDYAILLQLLRNYVKLSNKGLKDEIDSYTPFECNNDGAFHCCVHGKTLHYKVEEIRKIAELIYTLEEANPFNKIEEKREIIWV